jgi:hypothetical protein
MTETPESIADALTAAMAEQVESESETEATPDSISEEAVTETEEETVELEATDESEVEEDDDESEEPEKVFQAPEHWSSDERAKFDSLPPEAQEVLLERDKAFQKGYQEKAQAISAITEAIEPFKESLIRRGMTPQQAIGILFNAQDRLDKNPLEGILQIAQSYGIVDQLREQFAPQADEDDFTDPGIKALQQEIKELKGQIAQTNQGLQQQTIDAGRQQLETFKDAVDGDGKLLHPHFEQVMPLVTAYVQQGDSLQEAYEKAVWTVPEYRDSQVTKTVEKTDKEKAEKVKKAKRAARGVKTNGKSDPEEGTETLSLHDDLKEAFRQHSS